MRHIFQSVFKDGMGRIIPSATISVYLAGTVTTANVYAAATGGSHVTSVTTASDGSFSFFVSDSDFSLNQKFKITMTKTDFATKSYDNITIFAPVPTGIYYPDANATDQGAATTGGYSLKDIIDAAGSNNITIKFRNSSGSATTSYTLTTSETIPSTCAIEVEIGAKIVQGGSATLTINGPVVGNPMHQWLNGFAAGIITFGSGSVGCIYPEYFGVDGIDDDIEINLALSAHENVQLLGRTYYTTSTITIPGGKNLFGYSVKGSLIYMANTGGTVLEVINASEWSIIGIQLGTDPANKASRGLHLSGATRGIIDRLMINSMSGYGLLCTGGTNLILNFISNLVLDSCAVGLGFTGSDINANFFSNVRIAGSGVVTGIEFKNCGVNGLYIDHLSLEACSAQDILVKTTTGTTSLNGVNLHGVYAEPQAAYFISLDDSLGAIQIKELGLDEVFINHTAGSIANSSNLNLTHGSSMAFINISRLYFEHEGITDGIFKISDAVRLNLLYHYCSVASPVWVSGGSYYAIGTPAQTPILEEASSLDFKVAGLFLSTVRTFSSGIATPSVVDGHVFLTAGTTAITDFNNGTVGQTIKVFATGNITITHNASIIRLNGAINFSMTEGDTLTLTMYQDQIWVEDGRSVN